MSEQGPPIPGPEHKLFEPFAGVFEARVLIYMGPGDPHETSGVMTNSFHLNGMFLHQDFEGVADGPFAGFMGKGYWGYNQSTGQYEGFWIDSASSIMQSESGDVDDSGKVWTMQSELTNPGTGKQMVKRSVITLVDDDHHFMVTYCSEDDGPEVKHMEIHYTRNA